MRFGAALVFVFATACGHGDSKDNSKDTSPWTRGDACAALADPLALAGARCGEARGFGKHEDLYFQGKKMFYEQCCVGAECQEAAKRTKAEVDTCLNALTEIDCSQPSPLPKVCLDMLGDGRTSQGK